MPVRPPRPSGSCITRAARTSSARSMKARPSWTGWSRSRSAASRLPRPRPPASGATADQHHRYAGPRGFHRRSGAQPARAGWRGGGVRRRGRRAAAIGNGVAAGRQIQSSRASASSTRWTGWARISTTPSTPSSSRLKCRPVAIQLPIGAEDQFKGIVDLVKMKAADLARRNPGRRVRRGRDSRGPASNRPRNTARR